MKKIDPGQVMPEIRAIFVRIGMLRQLSNDNWLTHDEKKAFNKEEDNLKAQIIIYQGRCEHKTMIHVSEHASQCTYCCTVKQRVAEKA